MGFFGFKSSKEVEEEKKKAAQAVLYQQAASLSNQARGSQTRFRIPYFDAFDPRFETGVPVAVGITLVYSIDDMPTFLQLNAMQSFNEQVFNDKLKAGVTKFVKSVVSNAPSEAGFPLVQIERKIETVSELVHGKVAAQVERAFGITVRTLDVTSIDIDKSSSSYLKLKSLTSDLQAENILAQHNAGLSDFHLQHSLQQNQLRAQSVLDIEARKRQQEMQLGGQEEMQKMQLEMQRLQSVDTLKMQMENQRETMRIQREEMQRASKLQTEQTFLGAHQANLKAEMVNNATDMGINTFAQQPAAGGSPLGGMPQMPGMPQMKAAVPQVQYMVGVNGQPAGPFGWSQLQQMVQLGQFTQQTLVWKQGMAAWAMAGQVQELLPLFIGQTPPIPGMPQM